ncbi:hypothetical protein CG006_01585 [Mesoplasma florum]|uniref:hypothetical protein n=1 Tax=Mesoplasma florum TaxID=2151 RepID=UPI000D0349E0|nr:hypothetical protein [Mesoplasma florum]AVN63670.1 hypothetical protein CG006_01585 [Mesoplasma florum]
MEQKTKKQKLSNLSIVSTILLMIAYLILFSILWVGKWNVEIIYGNDATKLFGLAFLVIGFLMFGSNLKNKKPVNHLIVITLIIIGGILLNTVVGLVIWGIILILLIIQIGLNWEKYKTLFTNIKEKIRKK